MADGKTPTNYDLSDGRGKKKSMKSLMKDTNEQMMCMNYQLQQMSKHLGPVGQLADNSRQTKAHMVPTPAGREVRRADGPLKPGDSKAGRLSTGDQPDAMVAGAVRRVEGDISMRDSGDDVTKQLLIQRDVEIKELKRQLEDCEGQLENYRTVLKATNSRQQEEQRPEGKQQRTAAADYKPSGEHLTRIKQLKKLPEPLFSASCVAAEMFQCGALTMREHEKIRTSRGDIQAADSLLDVLEKAPREVFECFLQALRHTKQEHVYQQIVDQEFNANNDHCRLLRSKYLYLLDNLDTKHSLLTVHLQDTFDVLSVREKEEINAGRTSIRQNEKLLSVLCFKSAEQFQLFLKALDKTGQSHIRKHITGQTVTSGSASHVVQPNSAVAEKTESEVALCIKLEQKLQQKQLELDNTKQQFEQFRQEHNNTGVSRGNAVSPRLQFSLPMSGEVRGLTQCDNKLYVVCWESNTIDIIGSDKTKPTKIKMEELNCPTDIVSCAETQQLYVAGMTHDSGDCVWRVSLDGRQVVKWLPNKSTTTSQFIPYTLSVTSRRLLVTSQANSELLLHRADGVQLKRVPVPGMDELCHAVETSHGTFIVSHLEPKPRVCEVDDVGHVTRAFSDQQQLSLPVYLSLDSGDRVFVVDSLKHRILLLNDRLELTRILLDSEHHQLAHPGRLCYTETAGQLVVGGRERGVSHCVQLFIVRWSADSLTGQITLRTTK